MTAVDTSVCVPALLGWHVHHDECRRAAAGADVPAHAFLEVYSVLTRLPAPHRLDSATALRLLSDRFPPGKVLPASETLQKSIVGELAASGISGGGSYDGLIAVVARQHGRTLLTRDRRATRTYELFEADFEFVGT